MSAIWPTCPRTDLAELAGQPPGNYIVIPLEGDFNIGSFDPAQIASSVARVVSDPAIAGRFAVADLGDELVEALRTSFRIRDLRTAVEELRGYLERHVNGESTYQNWCNRHGWVFGIDHQDPDRIREIAVGDTVDFLLPTLVGYRDLVELKRPDMPVLRFDVTHRNYYWSSQTAAAIGQCTRYLEQLQDIRLRDHPELVAHHPRATIVIGRSDDWAEDVRRALVSLNDRLVGITVITFDLLLQQAERLLEIVAREPAS